MRPMWVAMWVVLLSLASWHGTAVADDNDVVLLCSLRGVERRPVLYSFKRIEGSSASKNISEETPSLRLHPSAASLPSVRVLRPRKHPRVSRVASSARAC